MAWGGLVQVLHLVCRRRPGRVVANHPISQLRHVSQPQDKPWEHYHHAWRVSILSHYAGGRQPQGDGRPSLHKICCQGICQQQGEPLECPYGDTGSWVMLGLLRLHTKDAFRQHQKSDIDKKTICPFCVLSIGNHESVKNHIRAHWCLGLMCGKCFWVELTCKGMVAHTKEAHHFHLK